uniref:Palmitoyltransferase n=1 Tax=Hanusia phi TaxID=3032 RepID=A0A7S0HG77_9CRYP
MHQNAGDAAEIRTIQPEDCLDDTLTYFWNKPPEGHPYFQGRNFVLWRGSLVFGPLDGIKTVVFTFILIAVPSALFLAYPARALIDLLSPSFIVLGAILVFLTLFLLLITAATDPGILPRFAPPKLNPDTILPLVQKFEVNGNLQKLKLCSTCQIYRPLTASHCSYCDNCVLDFDHHCPWIGTCIGRRNYFLFVMFIFSSTILSFYVLACSLLNVILSKIYNGNHKFEFKRDVSDYSISFFLMLYSFIIGLTVGSLALFHTCLLFQKKTTREYILNIGGEDVNYANRNTCAQYLCGKENFSFMKTILQGGDEDVTDLVKVMCQSFDVLVASDPKTLQQIPSRRAAEGPPRPAEGPTEEEWNTASTPTEISERARRLSSAAVDSACTPRAEEQEEVEENEEGGHVEEVSPEVALQVDEDVRVAVTGHPSKTVSAIEGMERFKAPTVVKYNV